jgi:hypothetical protein
MLGAWEREVGKKMSLVVNLVQISIHIHFLMYNEQALKELKGRDHFIMLILTILIINLKKIKNYFGCDSNFM